MANKIFLIGRLTKDIDVQYTNTGVAYARVNIAVKNKIRNADGTFGTDFFTCVAWRDRAETMQKYCKKGDQVNIIGSMNSHEYNKDGIKNISWEVNVDDVEFLAKNSNDGQTLTPSTQPLTKQTLMQLDDGEDLPF